MTNEIKPCPFCGTARAVVTKDKFSHPGTVGDGKCLLAGKGYFWEHIDWWNTRAGEPTNIVSTAVEAEVERLRVALEIIATGSDRAYDAFKEKLGDRSYPTWFAVNELQMGLDSITGTARAIIAQKEPVE